MFDASIRRHGPKTIEKYSLVKKWKLLQWGGDGGDLETDVRAVGRLAVRTGGIELACFVALIVVEEVGSFLKRENRV